MTPDQLRNCPPPPYTPDQLRNAGLTWPCNYLKPGGPHPSIAWREARNRKERLFLLAALLTVAGILALIHFPAYTLAAVCVGGPSLILGKVWLDCRWEAKQYKEEHDL